MGGRRLDPHGVLLGRQGMAWGHERPDVAAVRVAVDGGRFGADELDLVEPHIEGPAQEAAVGMEADRLAAARRARKDDLRDGRAIVIAGPRGGPFRHAAADAKPLGAAGELHRRLRPLDRQALRLAEDGSRLAGKALGHGQQGGFSDW